MYKKLKNASNNFADLKAQNYCSDLLKYNSDVLFATSKNFMENANKKGFKEIETKGIPVILTSANPCELLEPEGLVIRKIYSSDNKEEYYLATWCDENIPLAKIIYKQFIFTDGSINNKLIKNLHMELR